jgi:asparagine synthase (glutamine-hydrolysing)
MPGIFGFVRDISASSASEMATGMAHALEQAARFKPELHTQEGMAIGRTSLGILNPATQPTWNEARSACVVLEGELYDRPALIQRLGLAGRDLKGQSDAQLILALYEHDGEDFAACLNGQFAMAIWDQAQRKLLLASDRLGLHPLYYHHRRGVFAFASGVRALLVDPDLPRTVDTTAIAEFMTFDHLLGLRTLLTDVHLLPQASVLTVQDGQVNIRRYWEARFVKHYPIRDEAEYAEQMIFHLRQAVQRQDHDEIPAGLMLSGGLDSRILLALLAENTTHKLQTFTWSIPGSDDARYASEIARMVGAEHHFFELQPTWMLDKAENGVRITDGMGNLVNLHAIAALEDETRYAKVLYKGFLGDAMLGFGLRPRYWADYAEEDLVEAHLEAYRDYNVLIYDFPEHDALFTPAFQRQVGGSIRSDYLAAALATGSHQLADQRIYLDLTQRVPRMTINGVAVVRDLAVARLPFADNDLVDFSLTLPPYMRYERSLVSRAFAEAFPRLAKVPVTSTGYPLTACARDLALRARQLAHWHLDKRGMGWVTGPLRRPYKDYNKWFRTVLRGMVEDTLLSPHSLGRGYFRPEAIRSVVEKQMAGENHAVRLGSLMAIEMWHRQFIDQSPSGVSTAGSQAAARPTPQAQETAVL